jgi:DNA-damage-inducible protein D
MATEAIAYEIARARDAPGYTPNLAAARSGGAVAGSARRQLETETGERVVSKSNFIGKDKRVADPQRLTKK